MRVSHGGRWLGFTSTVPPWRVLKTAGSERAVRLDEMDDRGEPVSLALLPRDEEAGMRPRRTGVTSDPAVLSAW